MIVVSDTSVLLNLCRIGRVELLARLFHEVVIPLEVAAEFGRLAHQAARFQGLVLPGWVWKQEAFVISAAVRMCRAPDSTTSCRPHFGE